MRYPLGMKSRYVITAPLEAHFLTCTLIEWIPALTHPDAAGIITDALTYCRQSKGLKLYAYVVMDNHLHLVAEAPDLGSVLRDFKRHTARALLKHAEESGKEWLLNQFRHYRLKHKLESTHQVWQEGSHPKLILGAAMLLQKMEYIHNNPVRRGWVDLPEHWRWSSARNYAEGRGVIEIDEVSA